MAVNYQRELAEPADDRPRGRIARYALGDDYHEVIKPRLHALADAIRELAEHPQESLKMGLSGRRYLEQNFSRERMAGELVRLLEQLVGP